MKKNIYKYIASNNGIKDYNSIYFTPVELTNEIMSHHKRPLVRVRSVETGKTVIRTVRGIALEGLTKENCTIDYITAKELGLKDGDLIRIEKVNFVDKYFRFFYYSPESAVRLTYGLFIIATIMATVSISIGIYQLINH